MRRQWSLSDGRRPAGYWLSAFLGNVAYAVAIFAALSYLLPIFGDGNNLPSIIGASLCLWLIYALVMKGVKEAAFVNVVLDWGKPTAKAFRRASPKALREFSFPAGSMGPKVEAACHFAEATGKKAAIGALKDLRSILRGEAGTTVDVAASNIEWAA